jgi:hypothetical protein
VVPVAILGALCLTAACITAFGWISTQGRLNDEQRTTEEALDQLATVRLRRPRGLPCGPWTGANAVLHVTC